MIYVKMFKRFITLSVKLGKKMIVVYVDLD